MNLPKTVRIVPFFFALLFSMSLAQEHRLTIEDFDISVVFPEAYSRIADLTYSAVETQKEGATTSNVSYNIRVDPTYGMTLEPEEIHSELGARLWIKWGRFEDAGYETIAAHDLIQEGRYAVQRLGRKGNDEILIRAVWFDGRCVVWQYVLTENCDVQEKALLFFESLEG